MKIFKNDQALTFLQILLALFCLRFVSVSLLNEYVGMNGFNFFISLIGIVFIIFAGFYLYKIVLQEEYPDKTIIKNTEKAYYYYIGLNALGVIISFFVADALDKTYYFGFYLVIVAALYLYVTQWRKIILFDNIVLAFIITYPIFLQSCFDLFPTLEVADDVPYVHFVLDYALLWFVLIWILYFLRSILHDLIFVQTDIKRGKKTLATRKGRVVGAQRTSLLTVLPILLAIYINYLYSNVTIFLAYSAIAILIPLIVLMFKIKNSKTEEDFTNAKKILNVIIWLTIISIVTLTFTK